MAMVRGSAIPETKWQAEAPVQCRPRQYYFVSYKKTSIFTSEHCSILFQVAAGAQGHTQASEVPQLRVVHVQHHTGSLRAADGCRLLRRADEPQVSRVLRDSRRLLCRHDILLLRAQAHSEEQLRADAQRPHALSGQVRQVRRASSDPSPRRVPD